MSKEELAQLIEAYKAGRITKGDIQFAISLWGVAK
jgi:hypothetical protein